MSSGHLCVGALLVLFVIHPALSSEFSSSQTVTASVKLRCGVPVRLLRYSLSSGPKTASGAQLNPSALTAAHRTLPFGTQARVTNQRNGRSVIVTINDRGPFSRRRIIDLTPAAARAIGFSGTALVSVDVK
jgi:rare lipoprotein A